jgi:ATP-dependent protease ClpP protease subunit
MRLTPRRHVTASEATPSWIPAAASPASISARSRAIPSSSRPCTWTAMSRRLLPAPPDAAASPQQKPDLAAFIHLCGAKSKSHVSQSEGLFRLCTSFAGSRRPHWVDPSRLRAFSSRCQFAKGHPERGLYKIHLSGRRSDCVSMSAGRRLLGMAHQIVRGQYFTGACHAVLTLVIVFSGFLFSSTGSNAADVRTSSSEVCAFTLGGPIVAGDRDHFAALLAVSRLDSLDERTTTLCLQSPGGSFDEAIGISELLYDRGLSTIVVDHAECYSACAVVFMAGVMPEREAPYRKLSVGGTVGFHAPYLSPSEGQYSREQVEEIVQDMRKAILSLLHLSSRRTQLASTEFLKRSLIARMFESGPNEVSVVRTIAEAARWDIAIYDATELYSKPGPVEGMKNLCNNFHYGNMDQSISSPPELSVRIEPYVSKYRGDDSRVIVSDAHTKDTVCEIYPYTMKGSQRVLFRACSYDYWSSKSFGDCREYKTGVIFGQFVPDFLLLAPDTVLKGSN